jgi:protein SCO1/2
VKGLLATLLVALPLAAAAAPGDPPASLYQLDAAIQTQDGKDAKLDLYRGQTVLVSMFFASCQATCPVIIDTLRAIEKQAGPQAAKDLRVLLISFDSERDTPEALAAMTRERRIDTKRWTLAHAGEGDVRKIAAALGQQYRKLPDGMFSHATQISVLDARGEIVAQSATLGGVDEKLLAEIRSR